MSRFERISRKYEEEDAYIRDTGITVSEVVSAITSGQSVDDVLAKHDSIELEDVHQALAYAVYDLHELILFWRRETLNYLVTIKGYAEIIHNIATEREEILLIDSESSGIGLTLERYSKLTLLQSKRAIVQWNFLLYQAKLYLDRDLELERHQFSNIKENIEGNLHFYDENVKVKFEMPEDLPALQYDLRLEYAILLLVAYNHPGDPFTSTCRLTAKPISTTQVQISIFRDIKDDYPLNHLTEDIDHLFMRELPHSIASRAIKKHGSELKTEIGEDSVTFSFELPIWTDDET